MLSRGVYTTKLSTLGVFKNKIRKPPQQEEPQDHDLKVSQHTLYVAYQ